jgi:protocatechuate 3,4-dioxygenase beta subunit
VPTEFADHQRRAMLTAIHERVGRWDEVDPDTEVARIGNEIGLSEDQSYELFGHLVDATVFAGQRGEYRFQSNVPVSYSGRPPHIHVRVRAPGYEELVTQHYPQCGQRKANFDLVLLAQ